MLTKERIEQFYTDVDNLGLKFPVAAISEKTGEPKGNVSRYLSRKIDPSESFVEKFYKSFKIVNRGTSDNETDSYQKKRLEQKNNGTKPKVPVYGGFTTLGNITIIDDENVKNRVIAELPSEVFPGCDYSEKAKGDSMYPLIMNQALLVGKMCSVKGITLGEKYIIKTKDGLDTTKYVHPSEKAGYLILKAYNKSVPDQSVYIKDIVFSCRVYWIINPT